MSALVEQLATTPSPTTIAHDLAGRVPHPHASPALHSASPVPAPHTTTTSLRPGSPNVVSHAQAQVISPAPPYASPAPHVRTLLALAYPPGLSMPVPVASSSSSSSSSAASSSSSSSSASSSSSSSDASLLAPPVARMPNTPFAAASRISTMSYMTDSESLASAMAVVPAVAQVGHVAQARFVGAAVADADAPDTDALESDAPESDAQEGASGADADAAPEQTTIALNAHNLTHHDLRASRLPTTLKSLFRISKTSAPALASTSELEQEQDDEVEVELTREDVRQSRFGRKLGEVFGLENEKGGAKGVHFAQGPDEVKEFSSSSPSSPSSFASSTTLDADADNDDPHVLNLKSAFSLSPSTPKGKMGGGGSKGGDEEMVSWDGEDPENPAGWGKMYKWTLTAVVGFMTLNATFSSSAPSAAVPRIAEEFGVSEEVATLTTSIYLVGYIFGPAFWGPGSELLGRRLVLILTMLSFALTTIGQALAPTIGIFLGTRLLSGFFAVAPLVNGGGVVADIWDPLTRGLATTVFSTMIFLGPVIGPIVGGFIIPSPLGWRFVFWVIAIFAGCSTLLAIFVLPETHAPTLMAQKARRLRTLLPARHGHLYAPSERVMWTAGSLLDRTLFRPFKMLFSEPILLLVTIYISVVYGCLYSLFESVPLIFQTRNFNIMQTGLIFLAVGLGAVFSTLVDVRFSLSYPTLLKKWRGHPPPENRLYGAMIAGPAFVVSIFWLGWAGGNPKVHWSVVAVALVLVGFSVSLIFNSFMTYLVDTYLANTASAFAALTIIRSSVGAAFPLFIVQMFRALGIPIACSIIGALGVILAPIPFIFFRYGARIRGKSEFAPCLDLKVAEELEAERLASQV